MKNNNQFKLLDKMRMIFYTVNPCNKALGQESNNLIPYPGTATGYKNRNNFFVSI